MLMISIRVNLEDGREFVLKTNLQESLYDVQNKLIKHFNSIPKGHFKLNGVKVPE